MTEFFGKYRGTVVANDDPKHRGRVRVSVPAVLGNDPGRWADICVPYAGAGVGLFAVPPVGASIWVEYEAGNPSRPVVAGCFWDEGEEAPGTGLPSTKVLKTAGLTVTMEDGSSGGLTIEVGSPAVPTPMRMACTADGIELSIGRSKIVLTSSSVSINDGALEVT
jgi:hypothetical protein